jgi:hypothetical protein
MAAEEIDMPPRIDTNLEKSVSAFQAAKSFVDDMNFMLSELPPPRLENDAAAWLARAVVDVLDVAADAQAWLALSRNGARRVSRIEIGDVYDLRCAGRGSVVDLAEAVIRGDYRNHARGDDFELLLGENGEKDVA